MFLLFVALFLSFSVFKSHADRCTDLCTPKKGATCDAGTGIPCSGFEEMKAIPPIGWPTN